MKRGKPHDKRIVLMTLLALVVLIPVVGVLYLKYGPEPIHEANRTALIEALEKNVATVKISSSEDSPDFTVDSLKAVTPFEWDAFYVFGPYIPEDEIRKFVGDMTFPYVSGVNDGLLPIYFVKDGKVVCHVYGYPENIGIQFLFPPFEGAYKKLSSGSDGPWRIKKGKGDIWQVEWLVK